MGWWVTAGRGPGTEATGGAPLEQAVDDGTARPRGRDGVVAEAPVDFMALALLQVGGGEGSPESLLAKELAGWTPEELKTALEAGLVDPDCVLPGGPARKLAEKLMEAWMKRDAAGAIAWFATHTGGPQREWLVDVLGANWPHGVEEQGISFILTERELFEDGPAENIFAKVMEDRARNGPAALEALLVRMREGMPSQYWPGGLLDLPLDFPAGFDFRSLLASGECREVFDTGRARGLRGAWLKQDREGLYEFISREQGAVGIAGMFGRGTIGTDADWKWLGGKYEALPAPDRAVFFKEVEGYRGYIARAAVLAEGIHDPMVREEVAGLSIRWIRAGRLVVGLPLLESLPDPARRVHLLETAEPSGIGGAAPFSSGFDDEAENDLRGKLAEWHATPAQADAIIAKFKKPR